MKETLAYMYIHVHVLPSVVPYIHVHVLQVLERTQQRCRKNGKMCLLQYTKHLLSFIDIYM